MTADQYLRLLHLHDKHVAAYVSKPNIPIHIKRQYLMGMALERVAIQCKMAAMA